MATATETLPFQAETKELLHLMIHSLYTDKDIFLRELISNASDALDRLRFESITNNEILQGNDKFEIRLEVDPKAKTLTISDSGIGMTRDEVIANLGTIARSGTGELRRLLAEKGAPADLPELIGQFGVGFYSAFMVADKVTVLTRRAGAAAAIEWESDGSGTYSVREAEKADRGTTIALRMKPADKDAGIEDYTDSWRISSIVKKHSDFIAYPILLKTEDKPEGDTPLNSMNPIWKRPPADVQPEQYNEFYKHISHDWTDPMKTIHFRAEGTFEYEALLYIPAKAPFDLYYVGAEAGLRLFAKRVMIMEKCEDLLPHYLRFIRGVVDASDLPLNISRQRLQQDIHIQRVRKRLTTKVLESFKELFEKEYDHYLTIWGEFGRAIKEGVGSDFENQAKLTPLLLFASSNDAEKLTTLKDYVARMKPEQEQIYYLTGESRKMIENSPHLEALKEKGYEVLYMVDPVDEFLLQQLTEFEGKKFKSVGKGTIELGTAEERAEAEKELKDKEDDFKPLMEFLQKELGENVKQVRLSSRLTASPACLVVEEYEYSPMLERVLQKSKQEMPKQKRGMELNPKHPLILRLQQRHAAAADDPLLGNAAEVLMGLALLSEGSDLPDPVKFNRAATDVLGLVV